MRNGWSPQHPELLPSKTYSSIIKFLKYGCCDQQTDLIIFWSTKPNLAITIKIFRAIAMAKSWFQTPCPVHRTDELQTICIFERYFLRPSSMAWWRSLPTTCVWQNIVIQQRIDQDQCFDSGFDMCFFVWPFQTVRIDRFVWRVFSNLPISEPNANAVGEVWRQMPARDAMSSWLPCGALAMICFRTQFAPSTLLLCVRIRKPICTTGW